jgi:hypothetical protein
MGLSGLFGLSGPGEIGFAFHPVRFRYGANGINLSGFSRLSGLSGLLGFSGLFGFFGLSGLFGLELPKLVEWYCKGF